MPFNIRYINSFAAKTQHSVFNRATLSMFAGLWRGQVCVWSVPSSLPPLLSVDNADGVVGWHRLSVGSGKSGAGLALRYLQSAVCNVWELIKARPDDMVVYNFNNVFSIHLIDWLCHALHRRVLVFCHNELEYIVNADKHKSLQKKALVWLTNSYFSRRRRPARGLKFVVLGDSILQALQPLLSPSLFAAFYSIDHPVMPVPVEPHSGSDFGRPVNVGVVGTVNYYKGGGELAGIVREVGASAGVRFSIVGSVQGDAEPLRRAGIVLPSDPTQPIPDAEFSAAVSELDFILLIYPTDTYRLIASGAVLEAVRYGKPIIAYRTAYFDYLFNKFGAFGYLADTREELIELLRSAGTLSRDFPFNEIASRLTPSAIAPALREIVAR